MQNLTFTAATKIGQALVSPHNFHQLPQINHWSKQQYDRLLCHHNQDKFPTFSFQLECHPWAPSYGESLTSRLVFSLFPWTALRFLYWELMAKTHLQMKQGGLWWIVCIPSLHFQAWEVVFLNYQKCPLLGKYGWAVMLAEVPSIPWVTLWWNYNWINSHRCVDVLDACLKILSGG